MPQGKMKVKAQLPKSAKSKKGAKKGAPATQRANRPIQPKKKGIEEVKKMKQAISKAVNRAGEADIRKQAADEKVYSKTQQAVAQYNLKKAAGVL